MKDTFSRYHPLVNFIYFISILGFTMFFSHPIMLIISLFVSFLYSVYLGGSERLKKNMVFLLPTILITGIINPAFNHEGITIIGYLNSGNPITLESIFYGISTAVLLVSILFWFYSYNQVMESDKFIYLFGRVIPSISLVLSMALGFVPRFKQQLKKVSDSQRCLGRDSYNGPLYRRMKNGVLILSIVTMWSLENAIETGDSMRSRGYGTKIRTSFSIYRWEKRDFMALVYIFILVIYIIFGAIDGQLKWRYFPSIEYGSMSIYTISIFIAYICLCLLPITVNKMEEAQWRYTQLRN